MVRVVRQCALRRGVVIRARAARMTRLLLTTSLATALMTGTLITSAAPGSAAGVRPTPPKPVVDAAALTPAELSGQIRAADALRAQLMRSSAEVAAANTRLERLAAQANTLLENLSTARAAQVTAETEAASQRTRLIQLGVEVQSAQDALGRLASDSYIRGGGALGDMIAILEALTSPTADESTDSMATVQYLMDGRARVFDRLRSLRAEQVLTSARAAGASKRAAAAAKQAAAAKSALDAIVKDQRKALEGFRIAQTDQVSQAAGLRGVLLRSEDASAKAADRRLGEALVGQDFTLLIDTSSSCGKDPKLYPNGRLPASALCPMYAAPGESLSRDASLAFNAMSNAYQKSSGSPICVNDGYRSYAEQVLAKLSSPKLAASPGRSQHGLGLAVDLCGGVQNFGHPAHRWMQQHAPLYGWFHPSWAEPTGSMPEPWHWEFAS